MKPLHAEDMAAVVGGGHSLKQHLICVAAGLLAEPMGPIGVTLAMIACYASFE